MSAKTSSPIAIASAVLLVFGLNARAVSPTVDFQEQIQPLLAEHCQKCHGPDKQKSKLRLDSPKNILKGGESGEPIFLPGHSAESHLVKLVTGADPDEVMPKEGKRLTADEIGLLKAWIDQGAKMPGVETVVAEGITTDHWSFQPVKRPPVPAINSPAVANAIDAFVLDRLNQKGLTPSPVASRETLIRRLYLVMLGLPPTPEDVDAFVRDKSPDAYRDLVDRVLASSHYGERWARHWLDVVRYADSNGFETNRERKNAYPYRDYVIKAFNDDKPYDQFIKEQLAGDAMGEDAATGFLVAGPYDIVKSPDISLTLMQRQNELDDMINTTGTAFLGLTLGCARCHNHKFDPILQKDYYSMQAVFAGVNHGERPLRRKLDADDACNLAELKKTLTAQKQGLEKYQKISAERLAKMPADAQRPPVNSKLNEERFTATEARAIRFTILATSSAEPCIDELEVFDTNGVNVALASHGSVPTASGTLPGYEIHKLKHLNDGLYGNSHSWISDTSGGGWVAITFPQVEQIDRILWGRDRDEAFKDRVITRYKIEASSDLQSWNQIASSDGRKPYEGKPDPDEFLARLTDNEVAAVKQTREQIRATQADIDTLTGNQQVWAGTFSQPDTTYRLYRGDPFAKREPVAPDEPTVFGTLGLAQDAPEQSRRVKLANWIASQENPLTARVMVNRLWQYIFGNGIVATASDFGGNGVAPTHPELLDWLADEFVKGGWSIKHIQRLILNSNTFRQSSQPQPEGLARDAGDSLLWRFQPRRLEAEPIRDSILAVSGALDTRMGGPGFYLLDVQEENVMHYFPKEKFGPLEFRRMIYLFKIRQEQDAIFGSFDCPDGNQVIPHRSRSNTPLQALNLFNSQFVLQQANFLAERLRKEAGDDPKQQVTRAFELAFARRPDSFETSVSTEMIHTDGLESFCRALYNTSEFLFVF
ncbi:DUF1553 domain-containing protein [bacterium]|nr:DUF1553 domain-containing protein [bacterium]